MIYFLKLDIFRLKFSLNFINFFLNFTPIYPVFASYLLNVVECFGASICRFLHAMGGI